MRLRFISLNLRKSKFMRQKKTRGNPPLQTPSRVAVLVDTSTDWSRRVIAGISNYVKKHDVWQLFIEPHGIEEHLELQRGWQGDGVIARISNEGLARSLHARNIPVVNISGIKLSGPKFPLVTSDVVISARLAAEYFLDRGFRNFAYLNLVGLEYVSRQREAFVAAVKQAGCNCELHGVKTHSGAQAVDWNVRIDSLGQWLLTLPKPTAVFTWSGGREVIHACQQAGLRVPEDIALLSGTDDQLCEISHVPISAVRAACERIGYEAAAMLDKLMHQATVKDRVKLFPPLGVVSRQSTDTLAITNPAMAKAVRFILKNAGKPIRVSQVAAAAGIHRRLLERRFHEVMRRTPAEHIRRVHIDCAKKLLIETDLAIADVAEGAGFGSAEYLSTLFQKELGTTPLRYRRESQRS
jgi:LacI family transcriptional regulator